MGSPRLANYSQAQQQPCACHHLGNSTQSPLSQAFSCKTCVKVHRESKNLINRRFDSYPAIIISVRNIKSREPAWILLHGKKGGRKFTGVESGKNCAGVEKSRSSKWSRVFQQVVVGGWEWTGGIPHPEAAPPTEQRQGFTPSHLRPPAEKLDCFEHCDFSTLVQFFPLSTPILFSKFLPPLFPV